MLANMLTKQLDLKTTLETSGEDVILHSKRVEKLLNKRLEKIN